MIDKDLFVRDDVSMELQKITEKVFAGERINDEEGLLLFEKVILLRTNDP